MMSDGPIQASSLNCLKIDIDDVQQSKIEENSLIKVSNGKLEFTDNPRVITKKKAKAKEVLKELFATEKISNKDLAKYIIEFI